MVRITDPENKIGIGAMDIVPATRTTTNLVCLHRHTISTKKGNTPVPISTIDQHGWESGPKSTFQQTLQRSHRRLWLKQCASTRLQTIGHDPCLSPLTMVYQQWLCGLAVLTTMKLISKSVLTHVQGLISGISDFTNG